MSVSLLSKVFDSELYRELFLREYQQYTAIRTMAVFMKDLTYGMVELGYECSSRGVPLSPAQESLFLSARQLFSCHPRQIRYTYTTLRSAAKHESIRSVLKNGY